MLGEQLDRTKCFVEKETHWQYFNANGLPVSGHETQAHDFFNKARTKQKYLNCKMQRLDMRTVTIPQEEYKRLKKLEQLDKELLRDIARGIKDILSGKVKEV